jgi:tetratricopeptide (TPR) repeat protein
MRMGKFETAAQYYRHYLTENPKDLRTLRRLALIECYELGQYDSCAVRADTVLWYMPTDTASVAAATYAYTMLARQASEAGDTTTAQQRFDRMVEIHWHAGYWNYMNEYYERASRNYSQIIHLRPDSVNAYLRLGLIRWNRTDDDSALVWFRRAEEIDPLNEDALINQIVVLRNLHRIDEALSVVDRLAEVRAKLYPDSSFTVEPDTVTFPPMTLDFRGDTTHWRATGFYEYGTGF